jgi:hypothetical protein
VTDGEPAVLSARRRGTFANILVHSGVIGLRRQGSLVRVIPGAFLLDGYHGFNILWLENESTAYLFVAQDLCAYIRRGRGAKYSFTHLVGLLQRCKTLSGSLDVLLLSAQRSVYLGRIEVPGSCQDGE